MAILQQQEEDVVPEESLKVERCPHASSFLLDVAYSNPTKIDHYIRLLRLAMSTSTKAATCIQSTWKRYHQYQQQCRFIKETSASIDIQRIYRGHRILKKKQQQKKPLATSTWLVLKRVLFRASC